MGTNFFQSIAEVCLRLIILREKTTYSFDAPLRIFLFVDGA